jgi:hypothetical protein
LRTIKSEVLRRIFGPNKEDVVGGWKRLVRKIEGKRLMGGYY